VLNLLTVTNFALLAQAEVQFTQGLNILTGETGAGKSILIDALSAILGNRASVDSIRTGCDFFRVEAVFEIPLSSPVCFLLKEKGIELEEETLIISRRLSRNGKNSILVNGCHIPLSVLREIGEKLVDMHGQHENQALLRPESHLSLLDSFDSAIRQKLDQYQHIYQEWVILRKELAKFQGQSRERAQRIDMLTWQTKEIAAATLKTKEEEELEQEINILANAEKITSAVARAYGLLAQGSKGFSGVLTVLADIKKELEMAVRYDQRMQAQLTVITDSLYQLEESSMELRDYSEEVAFNPQRLAKLQERMDVIYKLKKKYGVTVDEILEYYKQAVAELSVITHYDEHLAELAKKQGKIEEQLQIMANDLDRLRRQASQQLARQICSHLAHLGMPKADLAVKVTSIEQFTPNGRNDVVLLFSANPGEILKPLHKIASGGELSRMALAIKTVCAHRDHVGIMVFDEIDAGIGGQTAQMVAERIAMVASDRQVLCITHLPQIACMADSHIYIEKQVDSERTSTAVKVLTDQERLIELVRMTSGNDITQLAIENASQMLKTAALKKEKWKNKA
jgi:DNA repair protein RecN (Recombination protein N)